MMDIMNEKKKNKIVWIDGIPCIDIGPDFYPRIGPGRHPSIWPGRPPRLGPPIPSKLLPPGVHEMWEFLQPKDFTSIQKNKEKNYLEQILKDLEELFKGDF